MGALISSPLVVWRGYGWGSSVRSWDGNEYVEEFQTKAKGKYVDLLE